MGITLELRRIKLTNFKGTKNKEILFKGNNVRIIGCNGSGKSTIASSVSWVMCDTDYNLVKNSSVVPLGMSECDVQVDIEFSLNGKTLEVSKSQRYKEKIDDVGKITSSVVNTYSINGVNKSYKDFVADLESRGIDVENFLVYTNPNCFLADTSKSGREKIRKILFEMASDVSDEDIAREIGADEVLNAMTEKGYSLEEIKGSAKATIKKIIDENGKQNEVINAKIEGMLSSKASGDKKALEAEKTALESDIAQYKDGLSRISDTKAEKEAEIARLNNKVGQIIKDANTDIDRQKRDLESRLELLEHQRTIFCADYDLSAREINRTTSEIALSEEHLSNWRDLYKKVQDETLDDKDLKCPTCGVEYSADRIAEIKENFESSKNERLNSYKARGEETKKNIERLNAERDKAKEKHSDLHKEIAELNKKKDKVKTEIAQLPLAIMRTDETDSIDAEIEKIRAEIEKDDSVILEETKAIIREKEAKLQEVIGQIAVCDRNADIDRRIGELREKRSADEVAKAQAEKTLDEVSKVEKAKNEKFAESINSQFDLVEWHLWDRQRNGTLIEVTEPYIDGKPMSSCANGSLVTLAKLSICESLQRVRQQRMPIWCDDASLFSANTRERIKLGTQFIQLIVADNEEVLVEGE